MMEDIHDLMSLQTLAIQLADSAECDELVNWLHLHAAANDGRLINYLLCLETGPAITPVQALNAAVTLGIMCFLHLIYSTQPYSAAQSIKHSRFEQVLQQAGFDIDGELSLWLYFMCAINDTLLPSRTGWANGILFTIGLGHRDWLETQRVLERFPYIEGMEERLMGSLVPPAARSDGLYYLHKKLFAAK